jgi:hypothetical protein
MISIPSSSPKSTSPINPAFTLQTFTPKKNETHPGLLPPLKQPQKIAGAPLLPWVIYGVGAAAGTAIFLRHRNQFRAEVAQFIQSNPDAKRMAGLIATGRFNKQPTKAQSETAQSWLQNLSRDDFNKILKLSTNLYKMGGATRGITIAPVNPDTNSGDLTQAFGLHIKRLELEKNFKLSPGEPPPSTPTPNGNNDDKLTCTIKGEIVALYTPSRQTHTVSGKIVTKATPSKNWRVIKTYAEGALFDSTGQPIAGVKNKTFDSQTFWGPTAILRLIASKELFNEAPYNPVITIEKSGTCWFKNTQTNKEVPVFATSQPNKMIVKEAPPKKN